MTEPRRSRGWVWYFVVLAVLTTVSATVLIVYNLRQQLQPDELAAARARWREKAPRDYDLVYSKQGGVNGTYAVEVRAGKVRKVTEDGRPLEARLFAYYGMDGLFEDLDRFVKMRE